MHASSSRTVEGCVMMNSILFQAESYTAMQVAVALMWLLSVTTSLVLPHSSVHLMEVHSMRVSTFISVYSST